MKVQKSSQLLAQLSFADQDEHGIKALLGLIHGLVGSSKNFRVAFLSIAERNLDSYLKPLDQMQVVLN